MAENKISFNRFTALPNNIATYGSTPEELKLQAGTPDPNPSVSPMPSATPADVHLALEPTRLRQATFPRASYTGAQCIRK